MQLGAVTAQMDISTAGAIMLEQLPGIVVIQGVKLIQLAGNNPMSLGFVT